MNYKDAMLKIDLLYVNLHLEKLMVTVNKEMTVSLCPDQGSLYWPPVLLALTFCCGQLG